MQKAYGYEMANSSRNIEEYCLEGEIPTSIMSLETDPITTETDQIGMVMLYQADSTKYIKRRKELKQNLVR